MLSVNELAIQSHVLPHVVRYYLRIGLLQPAGHQENGYRYFTPQDTNRVRFIRTAKHLGFTLKEIKQILLHADQGKSPCEDARKIIQHRIEENRIKIQQMLALQERMETTLEHWRQMPNEVPDGNTVCHLIESMETFFDSDTRGAHHERFQQ